MTSQITSLLALNSPLPFCRLKTYKIYQTINSDPALDTEQLKLEKLKELLFKLSVNECSTFFLQNSCNTTENIFEIFQPSIEWFQYHSAKLGLECFHETNSSTNITSLTICGHVIVIDFELSFIKGKESSGTVNVHKMEVSYATHMENDASLSIAIQNMIENNQWQLFVSFLEYISDIDKYNTQFIGLDFFQVCKVFRMDLQRAITLEKESGSNWHERLNKGLGEEWTTFVDLETVVAFWSDKKTEMILTRQEKLNFDEVEMNWARFFIECTDYGRSFLPSNYHSCFKDLSQVPSNDSSTEKLLKLSPIMKNEVPILFPNEKCHVKMPISFCMEFRYPIVTCSSIAKKIYEISQPGQIMDYKFNDDQLLELYLIRFGLKTSTQNATLLQNKAWQHSIQYGQQFSSFNIIMKTTNTKAFCVHRVPFNLITEIYSIFQLLRQQLTFNELLSSIYSTENGATDAMNSTTVDIEYEACEWIEIKTEKVQLKIIMKGGVEISVEYFDPNAQWVEHNEWTRALQISHSIPLLLFHILK